MVYFSALLANDAFKIALPGLISANMDREQRVSAILDKMEAIRTKQTRDADK